MTPSRTCRDVGGPGDPAEALRFLREARTSSRADRRRGAWLYLYIAALFGGFWIVPALVRWSHAAHADGSAGAGRMPVHASELSLLLAPTVLFLVLLLTARAAMWRGPVVLDRAATQLLLPSRISRRDLLLPRLRASAALSAAVGVVLGAVAGVLLQEVSDRPWALLTVAGAATGLSAALMACALGALVERGAAALTRRAGALFAAGWVVAAAAAAGTLLCLRGWDGHVLAQVLLWSGPWGWAAQPLLWAMGAMGTQAAAGSALALVAPALGLLLGVRELPRIPQSALRLRAAVEARVGDSVLMLDLRQARAGIPALRARRSSPLARLPPPRHGSLLIPWRDATCLLRNPRRLGWAAAWTAVALGASSGAGSLAGAPRLLAVVGSLVALYLAAAQLTEPARLESDDVRRSANLVWSFRSLALLHAVVPVALLLPAAAAGAAAVCALSAASAGLLIPLVASVPALVAAALVSSYRGVMPTHLTIGVDTPMGNTGPWQTAAWYARGPLAAIALLSPVCEVAAQGHAYAVPQLLWQLALAACGAWWVRRTAHRLTAG
ncbi:hypothetical protein [Streptomyces sp. NRRL F-5126]|uniref:hypothetical protein n=1 Tax=Streptomyces sp. NRRL F-5126 TaxID=1463857 RepID=UPI0004C95C5D|nr:hypothetical protein [Streptomyces sp. NRRL F-5126]